MQDKIEQKTLKPGGNIRHKLVDFYDTESEKVIELSFSKKLETGNRFEFDDVTYEVTSTDKDGPSVVKMVRYRIPDTATQFVHKCPAKKAADESMSRDDIIKVPTKRVKMHSHNRMEIKCPHCKTIFWKKHNAVPEEVQVDKIVTKKKKKKVKK